MESGKHKVTTKQQFEKLVELMEKHPETGRGKPQFGCDKNKTRILWEKFTVELNSLGPPTRSAKEWGRVWIHYKASLKRKLGNNRANQNATGGGPSQEQSLNSLEESVAQLLQTRRQVAPRGQAFGTQNIPPVNDGEEIQNTVDAAAPTPIDTNVSIEEDRPTSSELQQTQTPRRNRNVESERLKLLTVQTETQKELLKKIGRLEKTIYKNKEINKNLLQIKQKKYALYKKQAQEASELHELKVEVQKLKIAKLRNIR